MNLDDIRKKATDKAKDVLGSERVRRAMENPEFRRRLSDVTRAGLEGFEAARVAATSVRKALDYEVRDDLAELKARLDERRKARSEAK